MIWSMGPPMMSANCQVKTAGGQVVVELFGKLTASAVKAVIAKASAAIAEAQEVVFLTIGVTDCSEDARPELVALQKLVTQRRRRSAWVDDRSRFRGIALWVMHLADDQLSKAVATMEQGHQWLASTETREDRAARRAVGG